MVSLLEAKWIEYPSLDRAEQLKSGGRELLGNILYWTEKRDGSNISVWLTAGEPDLGGQFLETINISGMDFKVVVSSRNQRVASPTFITRLQSTKEYKRVVEYLRENPAHVIFGELIQPGHTPTRVEPIHKKNSYHVFDIYDRDFDATKGGRFLGYNAMYQNMYHFKVPTVNLLAVTRHTTLFHTQEEKDVLNDYDLVKGIIKGVGQKGYYMDDNNGLANSSFYMIRDLLLAWSRRHRREGVIVKGFENGMTPVYVKEKIDLPSRPKLKSVANAQQLNLPPLPMSEVMGAIAKVHADIGDEGINDKGKAMPLIARAVGEECKKHLCSQPVGKIFEHYLDYIRGLQVVGNVKS